MQIRIIIWITIGKKIIRNNKAKYHTGIESLNKQKKKKKKPNNQNTKRKIFALTSK